MNMAVAAVPSKTTLRRTRGWVGVDLGELVRFRDLMLELAGRDVKLRYKQTALGVAWVVLQPLLAAGILNFAFGVVAGLKVPGTPYFLFSFAGLIAWNIFGWTLTKTSLSMVGNSYLISKVYFPRLILPLSGTLSTLLDSAVSFAVLAVLLLAYGVTPGLTLVLVPLWIVLLLCMALGAGLVAAALTVQYRDVQHILPIVVPFLLYASPVAYDVSHLPARYRALFMFANPLAGLIESLRASLLNDPLPSLVHIVWSSGFALAIFFAGAAIFQRTQRKFADVI
jgi:homopolymeric O-antigen transport system permease protein